MIRLHKTCPPVRSLYKTSLSSKVLCKEGALQHCKRSFVNQPPTNPVESSETEDDQNGSAGGKNDGSRSTAFKMFESALTTFASITILGLIGYGYTRYYKYLVLQKIENAFKPGDPYLELAARGKLHHCVVPVGDVENREDHWIVRPEQVILDAIVHGKKHGHYYLITGEKGTGKSSMLIDAMDKIDGEGVSMFDAHADPEIFRVRLGKALDFEYHEDNIGSLFSIRGPRDASALLDIERAFNKLEKIAVKRRKRMERPLVLIINSVHLLRDDENGRDLLELIQQRAEQWAVSNLITIIFSSDDYWVYERLKLHASRMEVIAVKDIPKEKAFRVLREYRKKYHNDVPSSKILEEVFSKVGGRLSHLNRVAHAEDMVQVCDKICEREKTWFLCKCWILGEEMDDDVMDQQKYASAAMVLAKALADKEKKWFEENDPRAGLELPEIPLYEARHIMTRADFIQNYDQINVFTIDSQAMVRADSMAMQNAFREVCEKDGFDELLQATLDRISDIESLGRTRELTMKDLWGGGKYRISSNNAKGTATGQIVIEIEKKEEVDESQPNS